MTTSDPGRKYGTVNLLKASGETPAEAANIKIEGQNKWITIIQNAAKLDRFSK